MTDILAIAFGYILGSIPFGLVLSYLFGYGDIRKIGSGNIGATNVLRTGNKPLAFATLVLDIGKGAIAVLIVKYFVHFDTAVFTGLAAILGHMFPVCLKFKGGKGVATTIGTYIALVPIVGLISVGTWIFMAVVFRYSSLSALIALAVAPVAAHALYGDIQLTAVCALIAVIVWAKHHQNIRRLIKGEEPKIGKKKKDKVT